MTDVPERKLFLSRKTTFPIFTEEVADSWLQLLNLVLRIGTDKTTPGGEQLAEALNAVVTLELAAEEEKLAPWLEFDAAELDDYCRHFTTAPRSHERRPGYGERLRDWNGLDQLEAAIERLLQENDTRSATLVLSEPNDMHEPHDAPSVLSATFNVIDDQLFGSFVLRSSDVFTSWPLEAFALTRLMRETAAHLGVAVGTATFVVHAAHLYARDWERAERLLAEWFKRPLPLKEDASGIFLFGNDGGKARAMLLDHDASRIQWEEAFADPEDLSWYIVDVMPWLLPQHIRYVGQECASLMRAIREKECYEQG